MCYLSKYQQSFSNVCIGIQANLADGTSIPAAEALQQLCTLSHNIKQAGRQQIFCGNGASAAFSSHMALDWSKNAGVDSRCISDSAALTAAANDLGAEAMFSGPLQWHGRPNDLCVCISSSGSSANIIAALRTAREIGMTIVTLSGLKPGNPSRSAGDINFYVPAKTYGMVECAHQFVLHAWLDCYLGIEEWNRDSEQNMNHLSYVR